jgi:hypothetical protein
VYFVVFIKVVRLRDGRNEQIEINQEALNFRELYNEDYEPLLNLNINLGSSDLPRWPYFAQIYFINLFYMEFFFQDFLAHVTRLI